MSHKHEEPPPSVKVVLFEDEDVYCKGLSVMLVDVGMEVVGYTYDPQKVMELVETLRPDMVILDLKIDRGAYCNDRLGLDVAKQIKANYPRLICTILSNHRDPDVLRECISAGVEGYIIKHIDPDAVSIPKLIRSIFRGQRYYDGNLVYETYGPDSDLSFLGNSVVLGSISSLTKREKEVFELLVRNPGFTDFEISQHLVISRHTVKDHVSSIINKLGAKDRHEAVRLADTSGWFRNSDK